MDENDLLISLKLLLAEIIEIVSFQFEFYEDLRDSGHWDKESEKEFETAVCRVFNIELVFKTIEILSLMTIADGILQKIREKSKGETLDIKDLEKVLH